MLKDISIHGELSSVHNRPTEMNCTACIAVREFEFARELSACTAARQPINFFSFSRSSLVFLLILDPLLHTPCIA